MLPTDKLDLILRRHEELSAKLSSGVAGGEFATLSREFADLGDLVEAIKDWRGAQGALEGAQMLFDDPATEDRKSTRLNSSH